MAYDNEDLWMVVRCVKLMGKCVLLPGVGKVSRNRAKAREFANEKNKTIRIGKWIIRKGSWL